MALQKGWEPRPVARKRRQGSKQQPEQVLSLVFMGAMIWFRGGGCVMVANGTIFVAEFFILSNIASADKLHSVLSQ